MGAFLKTIISYLWSLVPLNSLGNNGSCDQLLLGSGPQIDWQSESLQKHAFKRGGGDMDTLNEPQTFHGWIRNYVRTGQAESNEQT